MIKNMPLWIAPLLLALAVTGCPRRQQPAANAAAAIPCAIIDSGVATERHVTFAATDNDQGGVMAARKMGELLGGHGKIVAVKYVPGSDSTTPCENGFLETIAQEFPGIQVVDAQYGQDTVETALQATGLYSLESWLKFYGTLSNRTGRGYARQDEPCSAPMARRLNIVQRLTLNA